MNKKGFTLIELIIVIAIIVIVVSIGAPNFFNTVTKKALEADEMTAFQLNDSTESYALVTGASMDYNSTNFVFSDCEVNGEYDADLMIGKLLENGFLISAPEVQSKNAVFMWDKVAREWIVYFPE